MQALFEFGGELRFAILMELELVKSPAQLRDDIEKAERAATLLVNLVGSGLFASYIDAARETPNANWPSLMHSIVQLKQDLAKAKARLPNRGKQDPKFLGLHFRSGTFLPPTKAKVYCAIFVTQAWELVRGRQPGVDNSDAHAACAALWNAACGSGSESSVSDAGWRHHIHRAKSSSASEVGYRSAVRYRLEAAALQKEPTISRCSSNGNT